MLCRIVSGESDGKQVHCVLSQRWKRWEQRQRGPALTGRTTWNKQFVSTWQRRTSPKDLELRQEPDVVGEQLSKIVDTELHQGQSINAKSKCEARVLVRVNPT